MDDDKKLDELSFLILLQETIELKQMLYQLNNSNNDFDRFEIYIPFLPILSSICLAWVEKFEKHKEIVNLPDVRGIDFVTLLKKVRISFKLYSDKRVLRAFKMLNNSAEKRKKILETDYNFFQRFVTSIIGQKDLGVFTIDDIPYGNTSQLSIYLEEIFVQNNFDTLNKWVLNNREFLIDYSRTLTTFINSITIEFEEKFLIDPTLEINVTNCKLSYMDKFLMDTKRRNILLGKVPLEAQLQLFNVLCQNNFINILVPEIFMKTGGLLYRLKLQTYLVSVNTIKNFYKRFSKLLNPLLGKNIEEIIECKEKYFLENTQFRNNIFHYSLTEISSKNFLRYKYYFRAVVESYVEMSFDDFIKMIDEETEKINAIIEKIINFR